MSDRFSRRRLLGLLSLGATTGLAGCSQGDSDGGGTATQTGTATPTETATQTGTATPTETATTEAPTSTPTTECTTTRVDSYVMTDTRWTSGGSDCVDYVVTGHQFVADGAELVIGPGTTVEFEEDAGLSIASDSTLNAVGTASNPVTLTGTEQTSGHWRGLVYESHGQNRLEHTVVEYGGSLSPNVDNFPWKSNIAVDTPDTKLSIVETTSRHSGGYGFGSRKNVELPEFRNNTFTANDVGPVVVEGSMARRLDSGSDYTGNGTDYVVVYGLGTAVPSDEDHTWSKLDADYLVQGVLESRGIVRASGNLTIEPGTRILFDQDSAILVTRGGSLTATGTPSETITFTAREATKGYWQGLLFQESDSSRNQLSDTIVEYGGRTDPDVGGASIDEGGNIVVIGSSESPARITIADSVVRYSEEYGIYVPRQGNVDACTGVEFTGNNKGPSDKRCPTQ